MPSLHITGDVSLGTILTICTLVGIAIRFGYRFGKFETTLSEQAKTITDHASRLEVYEGRIVGFVGDLQRLIGRMEFFTDRRDRPK